MIQRHTCHLLRTAEFATPEFGYFETGPLDCQYRRPGVKRRMHGPRAAADEVIPSCSWNCCFHAAEVMGILTTQGIRRLRTVCCQMNLRWKCDLLRYRDSKFQKRCFLCEIIANRFPLQVDAVNMHVCKVLALAPSLALVQGWPDARASSMRSGARRELDHHSLEATV